MSDLINRADLIAHLNACLAESDGHTPIVDSVLTAIKCAVEQMPAVDAVEVVRCKDCIHQVTEQCVGGTYQACNHEDHEGVDGCYPSIISQDWFCADGERKEATE